MINLSKLTCNNVAVVVFNAMAVDGKSKVNTEACIEKACSNCKTKFQCMIKNIERWN